MKGAALKNYYFQVKIGRYHNEKQTDYHESTLFSLILKGFSRSSHVLNVITVRGKELD